MPGLTREEQETHIMWNAATKTATIDTADPAVIRKLDKLAAEYPEAYRVTRADDLYGTKWYEVEKRLIRFGKPASEAAREAARAKARKSVLRRNQPHTSEII